MTRSYIIADNIVSSLGFSTRENIQNIENHCSGIRLIDDKDILPYPFYASLINKRELNNKFEELGRAKDYTTFEKMIIVSVADALKQTQIDLSKGDTLLILSTTKGNIELLDQRNMNLFEQDRVYLWKSAEIINAYFKLSNAPLVISNACVSGVLALVTAHDILQEGKIENIIVSGADLVTPFVAAGFSSFKALSASPCKPFDALRDGLSLGEGAGTIILSSNKKMLQGSENIHLVQGGTSNDANHISGPSRTGDGLWLAINKAMKGFAPQQISYICAHGTGTQYNDEMEAKAFNLARLQDVPLNSYKGYFGHTLGAAGIIESVVSIHSMKNNLFYKSLGYNTMDLEEKVNIISEDISAPVQTCLKTASGFGGCNAAILFNKETNNQS